ncbi:Metallo-dependent phosphatase-like protein [Phlebopus sp. FC_14]|nr:Metallo-dependent phosphatase-like protein [Phlebopus sp. FC_14]
MMFTTRSKLRNGLRFVWILAVLWFELGIFPFTLHDCQWPDIRQPPVPNSRITRLLILADPQIIDRHSYPERGALLSALSQLMVDLNLRKSWNAVFYHLLPDAVVVLVFFSSVTSPGDMMDNGRLSMPVEEYEAYFARYRDIFHIDGKSVPTYYIPGNHDIGLGDTASFSLEADSRYTSHFGPRNYRTTIGNHTLVFIDAPALAEEDILRGERGHTFDSWPAVQHGPVEILKQTASSQPQGPVIVFTHIPLSRPADALCGPLREKGNIRQGFGFGYQNTLMEGATEFILESLKPSLIFSGDDHDYCDYQHIISSTDQKVREVTVKSFSMAMGIRQPGFHLLSLTSTVPSPEELTQIAVPPPLDVPCLLPNQLGIYLYVYVPLVVISLSVLLAFNTSRMKVRPTRQTSDNKRGYRGSHEDSYELLHSHGGSRDADGEAILPPPITKHRDSDHRHDQSFSSWTWTVVFGRQRRRITLPNPCRLVPSRGEYRTQMREGGLLRGFSEDVIAVAWLPILVFVGAAWWVMHW